jgi:hypothetical protein
LFGRSQILLVVIRVQVDLERALPHRVVAANRAWRAHLSVFDRDPSILDRDRLEQFHKNVADTVHGSIEQYATVLGLQPNAQFQQDLNQAFFFCVLNHWHPPKPIDNSGVRAGLLRVDKWAAAAANNLRQLQVALGDLPPRYRDALVKNVEMPSRTALKLDSVSGWAKNYATQLTRKGGAPKMLAFDTLIKGLARAYQNATGRAAKVTWDDYHKCYRGRFVNLVEAVLPAVCALAGTTPPIPIPQSAHARGKYIYDATRAGAGKKKRESGQE